MDTNHIRQLIKKLQLVMRCPGCGKKYNLDEIFLRGQVNHNYFLQLNCSNCRTPVMATIAITGNVDRLINQLDKKIQMPSKTEIKSGQTIRFKYPAQNKRARRITNDDILDFHQFLKDFNGNFKKLLK